LLLVSLKNLLSVVVGRAGAASDHPAPTRIDWGALPLPALSGGTIDPDSLRGQVVLVVNTASKCGFTPQYAGLEALWQEFRGRGLVVLGVPSNDFGGQEPAGETEIASFCAVNYGVDFPLLAKQTVSGAKAHPLYRWAAERTGPLGVPRWNFHKLLITRDGRLLDWFSSITAPESDRLRSAIDRALDLPAG
jgi:glutathione peroxidase